MYDTLRKKIEQMMPLLNEKQLRRYLGSEAEALGHGGIAVVSKISGKARNTIASGIKENRGTEVDAQGVRKAGGGRKAIKDRYPEIPKIIEHIVSGCTFGNPENPLSYTTKSTRKIKQLLNERGYTIGHNVVGDILEELGYSLQLNQKMLQIGEEHPDRGTQFEFINDKAQHFIKSGLPVISVDAKKKEIIGNFIN
jgi:transposase